MRSTSARPSSPSVRRLARALAVLTTAVLAAAQSRATDPATVALGYALLYPAAMIAKLVIVQLVAR